MKLTIRFWSSHHNMILYSLLYFCEENQENLEIEVLGSFFYNSALLEFQGKSIFFDFSDDTHLVSSPLLYDYYFKRSLLLESRKGNVFPLNLQVNYSYKPFKLLRRFKLQDLFLKTNRTEVVRALDVCNAFTNLSHNAMDIRSFPTKVSDGGGNIIFCTRLWDPGKTTSEQEKERRNLQNLFRIKACETIRSNFENSKVGLFPTDYAAKIAPELLLNSEELSKKAYFRNLSLADICIADDGLKDSCGWKIGEYALFGKAIITTPLRIEIEDFRVGVNFEKLSSRGSYEDLPEVIQQLRNGKRYIEMGRNNLIWAEQYLHPGNYFQRIMNVIGINQNAS